jgi:hypothetical protein
MTNNYWITEYTTWKIYADSKAEARAIWSKYCNEGVSWTELEMKPIEAGPEADWDVEADYDWSNR